MEYPILPGLTPDGQIYRNEAMNTLEAMLPTGGLQSAHAPALLELPDGTLLCAWFAGTFEGSPDVSILCARLPAGASCWEPPVMVSGDPERSEQNPSLFLSPDGAVWAMYTAQLARVPGKDNMQFTSIVRRQISRDGGKSWGPPDVVFPREGTFCRQPIQVLASGRWLFSNWICTDGAEGLAGDPTVFQLSDDRGASWRVVEMPDSRGRVHANVVELGGGRLVAFLRSRAADWIHRSVSEDNGEHWSAPVPTPLPNNNSSISAIRLDSGRIAIACNPTRAPFAEPGKVAWPGLRSPVAVALSEDEGLTFPLIRHMEPGEGFVGAENATNNRNYEYPFLMQGRDGRLHLAFAWRSRIGVKWMSFTEADVAGRKREAQGMYNPTSAKVQ